MSRTQRLVFLSIAAVIAVVAVVIALSLATGGGDEASDAATSAPGPLLTAGKVQDMEVTEGDTVHLRVKVTKDDEVHIHGYDIEKELPAGQTVPISFKATITGVFEIELHGADEQIGQLRVNPQ